MICYLESKTNCGFQYIEALQVPPAAGSLHRITHVISDLLANVNNPISFFAPHL